MKNRFLTDKELDKESRENNFFWSIDRKLWVGPLSLFSKAQVLPHHIVLHPAQGLTQGIPTTITLMLIKLPLYVIGKVTISWRSLQ